MGELQLQQAAAPIMSDTAPLTGAPPPPPGALPRWVHPTGVSGGAQRIAPVAATGLHWPPVVPPSGDTAPCADCEPVAAWLWLQRAWGLFIICWAGCLALLVLFSFLKSEAVAAEEGSLVSRLGALLWTSSCSAGLTCFGWGVLGVVGLLVVLVGLKGARHPWSAPLLMVFSPLEDVNLGIVFGGSDFALEAAVVFFAVLIGLVAWTTYQLSRARATWQHLGCNWGSAYAIGCGISVVGGLVALGLDVALNDEPPRYGTHAAAGGGSIGLTLLVVFQTRELSGLCAAEEYILPGLFLFLPPQALTWWTSRTVAR